MWCYVKLSHLLLFDFHSMEVATWLFVTLTSMNANASIQYWKYNIIT